MPSAAIATTAVTARSLWIGPVIAGTTSVLSGVAGAWPGCAGGQNDARGSSPGLLVASVSWRSGWSGLVPYLGGPAGLWGFRPHGDGMSAPDTAAYYARHNGITTEPTVTRTEGRLPVRIHLQPLGLAPRNAITIVPRVTHSLRSWRDVPVTATPAGWGKGLCTISRAQAAAGRPLPEPEEASDLRNW